jgi:hypothetical protein
LPRARTGLFAPSRDWDALKRAYEAFEGDDLAPLAADNEIKLETLQGYARKKRWRRFGTPPPPPPPAAAKRKANGAKSKPVPKRKTKTRRKVLKRAAVPNAAGVPSDAVEWPSREELVRRIRRVIIRKLVQLELDMETEQPLSPADQERQSRLTGSLISNVEKLDGFAGADDSAGAAAGSGNPKSSRAVERVDDDADRLRREIAAKLERLRERLAR